MKKTVLLLLCLLLASSALSQDKHTLDELAGTYRGSWASERYEVSGTIVMVVSFTGGQPNIRAVFTGSEYFNEDELMVKFSPISDGIWKMDFKGKKSKITGTGIFDNGEFNADYQFKKFLWTDRGKWKLAR